MPQHINATRIPVYHISKNIQMMKYEIDRVTDIKQAAAMKCGGQGDRYTIWVNGKMRYLYFERNASLTGNNIGRWFVERR